MSLLKFVDAIDAKLKLISSGDKSYNTERVAQEKWLAFKKGVDKEYAFTVTTSKSFDEAFIICKQLEEHPSYIKERTKKVSSITQSVSSVNYQRKKCEKCNLSNHTTSEHRDRGQRVSSGGGFRRISDKEDKKEEKSSKDKSNVVCFNCGTKGHYQSECYASKPVEGFTPRRPFRKGQKRKREEGNNSEVKQEMTQFVNIESNNVIHGSNLTILDNGATAHCFQSLELTDGRIAHDMIVSVATSSGKSITAPMVGSATVSINGAEMYLKKVIVHPDFRNNLISQQQLIKDNKLDGINQKDGYAEISKNGKIIAIVELKNNLLVVDGTQDQEVVVNAAKVGSILHNKLGHVNAKYLHQAFKLRYLTIKGGKQLYDQVLYKCGCDTCIKAKSALNSLDKLSGNKYHQLQPRDQMHFDLIGHINPIAIGGERYILSGVDAATRFKVAIPVRTKDQVMEELVKLNKGYILKFGTGMKSFFSDNGTEYKGEWKSYCDKLQLKMGFSPPRRPALNGLVERSNRTIMEAARALIIEAGAPAQLWPYAVNHAVLLLNNTKRSPIGKGSSSQVFNGNKTELDVDYLHLWGSNVFVHIPEKLVQGKFDEKAMAAIYIGWDSNKSIVMDPITSRVYKSESIKPSDGEFTLVRELRASLVDSNEPHNDEILKEFVKQVTSDQEQLEIY
jgi:hypothetical protein